MSIRQSAFLTAGLLGGLLLAGPFTGASAGDGTSCDKGKKRGETTTLSCPASGAIAHGVRGASEAAGPTL